MEKLVSSMRPAVKIITISPNINISRQVSLLWGVQSINSRDARLERHDENFKTNNLINLNL